ncbi:hypothetical protein WDU94_004510 [Cyamophila willieti]
MNQSEKITSCIEIENILLSESLGKSEDDEQEIDTTQDNEEDQAGEKMDDEMQVLEKDCKTPDKTIQNKLSLEDPDGKSSSCKRRLFKVEHQKGKKSKKNIFKNDFKKINYSSSEDEEEKSHVSIKTLSETKRNDLNPYVSLNKSDVKRKRLAKDLEDDFNVNEVLKKSKKPKLNPDSDGELCSKENTPVNSETKRKRFNTSDSECSVDDVKQNRSDETNSSAGEEKVSNKTEVPKQKMGKKKASKKHVNDLEKKKKKKLSKEIESESDGEHTEKETVPKKKQKSSYSKLNKMERNASAHDSKTESEDEKQLVTLVTSKKKQKSNHSKLKKMENESDDKSKEETEYDENQSLGENESETSDIIEKLRVSKHENCNHSETDETKKLKKKIITKDKGKMSDPDELSESEKEEKKKKSANKRNKNKSNKNESDNESIGESENRDRLMKEEKKKEKSVNLEKIKAKKSKRIESNSEDSVLEQTNSKKNEKKRKDSQKFTRNDSENESLDEKKEQSTEKNKNKVKEKKKSKKIEENGSESDSGANKRKDPLNMKSKKKTLGSKQDSDDESRSDATSPERKKEDSGNSSDASESSVREKEHKSKKVKAKDSKKAEDSDESESDDEKNESSLHEHSISNSHDSESEEEKTNYSKSAKPSKKQINSDPNNNPKIVRLKKYMRMAGIWIKCYAEFWEGCKSIKAKQDKMVQHMQKLGLKGPPTKASCAKLRKKLEQKKEIEALDVSNILDTPEKTYRGKRTRNTASNKSAADPDESESRTQQDEQRERHYARLRLLASSSDEE